MIQFVFNCQLLNYPSLHCRQKISLTSSDSTSMIGTFMKEVDSCMSRNTRKLVTNRMSSFCLPLGPMKWMYSPFRMGSWSTMRIQSTSSQMVCFFGNKSRWHLLRISKLVMSHLCLTGAWIRFGFVYFLLWVCSW